VEIVMRLSPAPSGSKPSRDPLTRFVILNAPRTGSNYLCTLLNSHPEILCHHEIFNPHVVGVARHLQNSDFHVGTIEEREKDPVEFLGRVWQQPLGRSCVGFKLCWKQNEAIFHAVLADTGIRKIVLKRKNRIKSFVSLLLARQTGEWVIYEDAAAPGIRPNVPVDEAELLSHIAFNDAYYGEIEAAIQNPGQMAHIVYYEDLFSEPGLRSTLSFLDVAEPDPALLAGQTRKLSSSSLRDLVANFESLEASLRGTALEEELHSVVF
jgi:LPS sulfotransferase NodH